MSDPPPPPEHGRSRLETARLAAAAAIGVVVTLFAGLNFDEVEVNWILGSWSTPLIVVIVVSFLLGAAGDRLLIVRRRAHRGSGD